MNAIGVSEDIHTAALPRLPVRESYSSLSTYEACPRRYAYRYVEQVPGLVPPGWFTFGSAIHRAFEAFDRARVTARCEGGQPPGFNLLERAFTKAVDGSGCAPDLIARFRLRGEPVLQAFLKRESDSATEPIAVELGFGVDVPVAKDDAPVRFCGYIDRVDRRPDGAIEILDHKTGAARTQEAVDLDRQLTAYAFAGSRGGLHDPNTGNVLPIPVRLGLNFAEPGFTIWTTRSAAALDAFGARIATSVRAIRRRAFAPRPGPACRWCEYRSLCPDVV